MADQFDPYYEWLGIKPENQPPDYYALIGIERFEGDPDLINRAADERMSYVRTLSTGRHAARSQKILNEISAARVRLLDAKRKAAYDDQLRESLAAVTVVPPTPPPPPPAIEGAAYPIPLPPTPPAAVGEMAPPAEAEDVQPRVSATPATATRYKARRYRRSKSSAGRWLTFAVLVAVLAGVIAFIAPRPNDRSLNSDEGFASDAADDPPADNSEAPIEPPKNSGPTRQTEDFQPADPIVGPDRTAPSRASGQDDDLFGSDPTTSMSPPRGAQGTFRHEPPANEPNGVDESDSDTRASVPSSTAIQEAAAEIREQYDLGAARTAADRRRLAGELIEASRKADEAAARFAALEQARSLAMEAGDLQMAVEVALQQSKQFDVDQLAILKDIVTNVAISAQDKRQNEAVALVGTRLIGLAIDQERFDLATEIADAIVTPARRAGNAELPQQVQEATRHINILRRAYDEAKPALDRLANEAGDPQSNAVAGRYYCFVKSAWDRGLPLIANGAYDKQRSIAELELANPATPDAMATVADGWYACAADDEGLLSKSLAHQKETILRHALAWYQRASTQLDGPRRQQVRSRIDEIKGELEGKPASGGRNREIWYMADVSMKPFPTGTSKLEFPRQTTEDPRGPFQGRGVYFQQNEGRSRALVFEINWDRNIRQILIKAAGLRNCRFQILDHATREALFQSRPLTSGNQLRILELDVPPKAGRRFFLHLHNENPGWLYVERIDFR